MTTKMYQNLTPRSMSRFGVFRELCYALDRVGLEQVVGPRIFGADWSALREYPNQGNGLLNTSYAALYKLPWSFEAPDGTPLHCGLLVLGSVFVSAYYATYRSDLVRVTPFLWDDTHDFSNLTDPSCHWARNVTKSNQWDHQEGYGVSYDWTYDPIRLLYDFAGGGEIGGNSSKPHKGYEYYYSSHRSEFIAVGNMTVIHGDQTLAIVMGSSNAKETASNLMSLVVSKPTRVPGFERATDYIAKLGPVVTAFAAQRRTDQPDTDSFHYYESFRSWSMFNQGKLSTTLDAKRMPQRYEITCLDSAFRSTATNTQIVWDSPETINGRGYQHISPLVAFPFALWGSPQAQFGAHPKDSNVAVPHISDALYLRDVAYSDPLAPQGLQVDPNTGDTWYLAKGYDSMCAIRVSMGGVPFDHFIENGDVLTTPLGSIVETYDIAVDVDGDLAYTTGSAATGKCPTVAKWPNTGLTWDVADQVFMAAGVSADTDIDGTIFHVPHTLLPGQYIRVTAEVEFLATDFPVVVAYQPNLRSVFTIAGPDLSVGASLWGAPVGKGSTAKNSNEPNDPYSHNSSAGWGTLEILLPTRADLYPTTVPAMLRAFNWTASSTFRMRNLRLTVHQK